MEENSSAAHIKGIICRHLQGSLIQFEKCVSECDNCFCGSEWIEFPCGDSVTLGSGRTVTVKDPLIELSAVADMTSSLHPPPPFSGGTPAYCHALVRNRITACCLQQQCCFKNKLNVLEGEKEPVTSTQNSSLRQSPDIMLKNSTCKGDHAVLNVQ